MQEPTSNTTTGPFPLPWQQQQPVTTTKDSDAALSPNVAVFAETIRELTATVTKPHDAANAHASAPAGLPYFPSFLLPHTRWLLQTFPGLGEGAALARVYPYLYGCLSPPDPPTQQGDSGNGAAAAAAGGEGPKALLAGLARRVGVDDARVGPALARVVPLPPAAAAAPRVLLEFEPTVDAASGRTLPPLRLPAPAGGFAPPDNDPVPGFVETPTTRAVLTAMCQEHALGRDVCVVGGKGVGKSRLARVFARRMGYGDTEGVEVFPLFREMTPRDLLQRRATADAADKGGSGSGGSGSTTIWADSPLVAAARRGAVCVLDGVHRLHPDTLASLARLVQDRAVELYDGTRLVRPGTGVGEGDGRVVAIHPSFRIVALGESGGGGKGGGGRGRAAASGGGDGMQVRVGCCVYGNEAKISNLTPTHT